MSNQLGNINFIKHDALEGKYLYADILSECNPALTDRAGNVVDAAYCGRKYKILKAEHEYYSTGERIARALKAFFTVLFTLGFILANSSKRQEMYDLFCSQIRSTTTAVTRYRVNNDEQMNEIASLLKNDPTLVTIKDKCKEVGFHISLRKWKLYELLNISETKNADIIEYFVSKSKETDESQRRSLYTLMLRNVVISLAESTPENRPSHENISQVITQLIALGGDLNFAVQDLEQEEWHYSWVDFVLSKAFDRFDIDDPAPLLNHYLSKAFEWHPDFQGLQKQINTSEFFRSTHSISIAELFKLYKSDDETLLQRLKTKMEKFRSDPDFTPELETQIYIWLADIATKSNEIVKSILQDHEPMIALLLSLGAKTATDIKPLPARENSFCRKDYFICLAQHIVDTIREKEKTLPPFLTLQHGGSDRRSDFGQLPKELIQIIQQNMVANIVELKFPKS